MKNHYLAKSNPVQSIVEHTEDLLLEYDRLKSIYPQIPYTDWELLREACIYHDLGKINTKFQNKIMGAINEDDSNYKLLEDRFPHIQEIPHGYLSCAFVPHDKFGTNQNGRVLIQAIYYHHKRPPVKSEDLKTIVNGDLTLYFENYASSIPYLIERPSLYFRRQLNTRIRRSMDKETALQFVMVKGLLNRIDYAASAGVAVEIPNPGLRSFVDNYLNNELQSEPNELQKYMLARQEHNNIIIASTGIGKTEGALYWIGSGKGLFTLPLRVSINSIYERIYKKLNFDQVGLLHSETASEYLKHDVYDSEYYEQTKQWTLPLTICTLDQILDFVFKQEGFEMKLATLAYSKLVIDEIQMYSPKMLACLLYALKEITEIGGKFTIMTATFAPFIADQMKKLDIDVKMPDQPFFKLINGQPIVRHRMQVINDSLTTEMIKENKQDKKILVIVNTVQKAQELYEQLKDSNPNINLFHSRFIKRDRKEKEDCIMAMGDRKSDEAGIWITTQVVEASVDIDFDVLYTELSDLNGLFQRMGRVYRNRQLDHDRVNVYVFNGGADYTSGIRSDTNKSVIDLSIFKHSKDALSNYTKPTVFTEQMKIALIEQVYTTEKLKESDYYKELEEYLKILRNLEEYQENLDDRIKNLRNIFNETVIPYEVYSENQKVIQRIIDDYSSTLHKKTDDRIRKLRIRLRDELDAFTVDIPKYRFKNAKSLGREVLTLKLGNFMHIPIVDYPYDSQIGLSYANEPKSFDEKNQFI